MNNKKLPNTKKLIQDIVRDHRVWNAKQIYDEYCIRIKPKAPVTLNAVQKQVSKLKGPLAAIDKEGLDQPWHFGLLRDRDFMANNPGFNINPNSASVIFDLQKFANDKKIPFTARQAFWVNLIFYSVRNSTNMEKYLERIYGISKIYADFEWICRFEKKVVDTTILDLAIYWLGSGKFDDEDLFERFKSIIGSAPNAEKERITEQVNDIISTMQHLQEIESWPEPDLSNAVLAIKKKKSKKDGE